MKFTFLITFLLFSTAAYSHQVQMSCTTGKYVCINEDRCFWGIKPHSIVPDTYELTQKSETLWTTSFKADVYGATANVIINASIENDHVIFVNSATLAKDGFTSEATSNYNTYVGENFFVSLRNESWSAAFKCINIQVLK